MGGFPLDYQQILGRLCALPGPSGFEGPVAQAAAILPSDSNLLLQYHTDGGSALTVGWMQ